MLTIKCGNSWSIFKPQTVLPEKKKTGKTFFFQATFIQYSESLDASNDTECISLFFQICLRKVNWNLCSSSKQCNCSIFLSRCFLFAVYQQYSNIMEHNCLLLKSSLCRLQRGYSRHPKRFILTLSLRQSHSWGKSANLGFYGWLWWSG